MDVFMDDGLLRFCTLCLLERIELQLKYLVNVMMMLINRYIDR